MRIKGVMSFLILFLIAFSALLSFATFAMEEPSRKHYPLTNYNMDFWDVDQIMDPSTLDVEIVNVSYEMFNGKTLRIMELYYTSEVYNGRNIRIFGREIAPNDTLTRKPAVVFMHGFGGNADIYLETQKLFAGNGYVTFAIDAPSAPDGRSTDYPARNAWSIINVTRTPKDSYLYHFVLAGFRAITLMYNKTYVDKDNIYFVGRSLGAVASYIIGAIDNRVKAVVPVSAAGNYLQSILSGSLINALIPPNTSLDSEVARKTLEYFDVYGYAQRIEKPIFILATTNDEFFDLYSFNDTFAAIKSKSKFMAIQPNQEHWGEKKYMTSLGKPEWSKIVLHWIEAFSKNKTLPKIENAKTVTSSALLYATITVKVRLQNLDAGDAVNVYWREGLPTCSWKKTSLSPQANGDYVADILTFNAKTIYYYVGLEKSVDGEKILVLTSPIYKVDVVASIPAVSLILLSVLYAYLYSNYLVLKQEGSIKLKDPRDIEFLKLVSWALVSFGLYLPWVSISNRTQIALWVFFERYKYFLGIPESLIYVIMLVLALGFPLALAKKRLMWLTILPVALFGLLFNEILNRGFAGQIIIGYGVGAILAVIGMILYFIPALKKFISKKVTDKEGRTERF